MAIPTSACARAGGIVDPVAHHGHRTSLGLEPAHLVGLVSGQHLGKNPADANLPGYRLGGPAIVAGDHDDLDAAAAKGSDRGGGLLLRGVGHRQNPDGTAVHGHVDRRLALRFQRERNLLQRCGVDPRVLEQPATPDHDLRPSMIARIPTPFPTRSPRRQ
jgi:hypothetical protein